MGEERGPPVASMIIIIMGGHAETFCVVTEICLSLMAYVCCHTCSSIHGKNNCLVFSLKK